MMPCMNYVFIHTMRGPYPAVQLPIVYGSNMFWDDCYFMQNTVSMNTFFDVIRCPVYKRTMYKLKFRCTASNLTNWMKTVSDVIEYSVYIGRLCTRPFTYVYLPAVYGTLRYYSWSKVVLNGFCYMLIIWRETRGDHDHSRLRYKMEDVHFFSDLELNRAWTLTTNWYHGRSIKWNLISIYYDDNTMFRST